MLWRYIWFRSVAFEVARAAGIARLWLSSGWRPHVIGLAVVGGGLASRWNWPVNSSDQADKPAVVTGTFAEAIWTFVKTIWTFVAHNITWTYVFEVIAVYVLLLIFNSLRSRKNLVVLATDNKAGDDFKDFADGLAADLAQELGELCQLYKAIDEANPPESNPDQKSTEVTVRIDNPESLLANVVGQNSTVKLGLLEVPLRPLVTAIEGLMNPGWRLSTSLQRNGNCVTLVRRRAGPGGKLEGRA